MAKFDVNSDQMPSPVKKKYCAPTLSVLGTLASLTTGASIVAHSENKHCDDPSKSKTAACG
ncbi:MAG: hypothetical protein V7744_19675 [Pseudomonadales bacterium]